MINNHRISEFNPNPPELFPNETMGQILKRQDLVHPELSYRIIGIQFQVHRELGNSLQEKYYQRAVASAFRKEGIAFEEQVPMTLTFGSSPVGRYRLDFVVEDKIILEIKTVSRLTLRDFRQVDGYLRVLNKELGLLVNYRSQELAFRRILNPAYSGYIR